MKTNELAGAALDWAVAQCEGFKPEYWDDDRLCFTDDWGADFEPSCDWLQGGKIIERERISVTPRGSYWNALYHDNVFEDDGSEHFQEASTPLIAAMRCYVASKLGDEVQIPEELFK